MSLIPHIFIYFKAYFNDKINIRASRFYPSSLLFIIIFVTLIITTMKVTQFCHNILLKNIYRHIAVQLYIIQNLILVGLFFHRLHSIFNGTDLGMSRFTIISFYCIFTALYMFAVIAGILWVLYISLSLVTIAMGFGILLTIYLVGLYTYKLYQLFRLHPDQDLLGVMRKTSFLVFYSTFISLLTALCSVIFIINKSVHMVFIFDLVIIADMYSSFLCIYLSFRYFSGYYDKVCGYIESRFFMLCCSKYIESIEHESNIAKTIKSTVNI